jgi:transcriptional regulator with XRE-family HTH domain
MLTALGKLLRKLRIDRGEVLKDMAYKLEMSSAYLSAIELGKRNAPETFTENIRRLYSLDQDAEKELGDALDETLSSVKINLSSARNDQRNAALVFARSFERMDQETAIKIQKLFDKGGKDID